MKWWVPLVALPLGLVGLVAVAAAVDPEIGARVHRALRRAVPHEGSTLSMDDGVHSLYVAWNDSGVQDAAVDDKTVPTDQVSVKDGVVRLRGVTDAEGWPMYELVAFTPEAQRRTLPGDAGERLGLRFAAQPEADGAWPVRADALPRGTTREPIPGPAQEAGVQAGDVLIAVDGLRPATPAAMTAALAAREDDAALPIVVRRAGAEVELVLHPLALTAENFWFYGEEQRRHHPRPPVPPTPPQGTDKSR